MEGKINSKPKVSCVVPAYNEERTIGHVLTVLTASPFINEIIVVDDGSRDETASVVRRNFPQVGLISKPRNEGKADALLAGARAAGNPVLFFCDADLSGLKLTHLESLIKPVVEGEVRMMVGVQEYMSLLFEIGWYRRVVEFLKRLRGRENARKSDFTKGLGGEKVLFKEDFLSIPDIAHSDYGVELRIVTHFKENSLPFKYQVLRGVGHVWKLKKWGFKEGIARELKAFATFARQLVGLE